MTWKFGGRDKRCDLDSSRHGQEMSWTVPGRDKRHELDSFGQEQGI